MIQTGPTPELPIERFEIFAAGLDHPECIAFDREGFLWAGGEAGQVYRVSPDGRVATIAQLGGFNAGVAFSPDGDLFVCNTPLGVARVAASGASSVFASEMISPNFALFAPDGSLYVTDSGRWKKRNGRLLRFNEQGRAEVILSDLGYANGLAMRDTQLYMVESDTASIRRVPGGLFAEGVGRFPDGIGFDEAGDLYAACYASDEIWRIDSSGAKHLYAWDPDAILLSRPTNLVFHGDYLYIANFGRQTIARARVRP